MYYLKQFLKTYFVPPGLVDLSRRFRPGYSQRNPGVAELAKERPLKAVPFKHTFKAPEDVNIMAVTRGAYDTRFAAKCRSGNRLTVGPFPSAITYLQFAVTPGDGRPQPSDLAVDIDGQRRVYLRGDLDRDEWSDVRISLQGKEFFDIRVDFEGPGSVYVTSPIGGGSGGRGRNILVILTDALLPSLVGCYDDSPDGPSLTPNIDRFFAAGRRFTNAHAQNEWTMPALASMVTGLYPIQHGVYNPKLHPHQRQLPPGIPTLPEILRDTGYRTFAFSNQGKHTPLYGHHRGYDRFHFSEPYVPGDSARVVRDGMEFMAAHSDDDFYCYLSFMESHPPFGPLGYLSALRASPERVSNHEWKYRKLSAEDRLSWAEEYDQIAAAKLMELDFRLGTLFDYLERSELAAGTTVFLMSDHGRTYSYRQRPLLTRDVTHVPLLVREPGGRASIHDGFVESSTDLFSTILGVAGLTPPEHALGRDILAEDWSPRTMCLSESAHTGTYEIALRDQEWLYIYRCGMDPRSGDVHSDTDLKEYLFHASAYPSPENYDENLADTERNQAERFRKIALSHALKALRHFDERSFLG